MSELHGTSLAKEEISFPLSIQMEKSTLRLWIDWVALPSLRLEPACVCGGDCCGGDTG
jgi:hypothetical protein